MHQPSGEETVDGEKGMGEWGWGDGQSEGTTMQREGESKTSRKTAIVRGRTAEIKKQKTNAVRHFPCYFFRARHKRVRLMRTTVKEVGSPDGCHSKQRRKRVEGPGRRRAGKNQNISSRE